MCIEVEVSNYVEIRMLEIAFAHAVVAAAAYKKLITLFKLNPDILKAHTHSFSHSFFFHRVSSFSHTFLTAL